MILMVSMVYPCTLMLSHISYIILLILSSFGAAITTINRFHPSIISKKSSSIPMKWRISISYKPKKSRTELVKVSSLSKQFTNHSVPRIGCIIFHKLDEIYRYLKLKETLQESIFILNLNSPPNSCVSFTPYPYQLV